MDCFFDILFSGTGLLLLSLFLVPTVLILILTGESEVLSLSNQTRRLLS